MLVQNLFNGPQSNTKFGITKEEGIGHVRLGMDFTSCYWLTAGLFRLNFI